MLFVTGTDADPLAIAICKVLFLPDGGCMFEGVDRILASRKRFGSVGHAYGDQNADVSDD